MPAPKKQLYRIIEIIRLLETIGISSEDYCKKFGKHRNQFKNDRDLIEDMYYPLTIVSRNEVSRVKTYYFSKDQKFRQPLLSSTDKELLFDQLRLLKEIDYEAFKRINNSVSILINDSILIPDNRFLLYEKLSFAIQNQKKVRLYNYISRGEVKDYKIEPIELTSNKEQLYAYDCESKTCKTFKLSRINGVEVSKEQSTHQQHYIIKFHDSFGFSSPLEEVLPVSFKMTKKANNIFCEEFPCSSNEVKKLSDNQYEFNSKVGKYTGVGRFVLGMLDQISDVQPQEFRDHLIKIMRNF
ncbi:helix-turn-helix transcriptional regulator [Flammeovirga aprica]|uniref:WYL domain-containing protein n=1 Tax=Flammeovirga aprica JL-4 TaxID=694437 RepID=A0A7X9P0L1_9BACT|nr:WYL domain-containing protein [Flammeovirga aprica]NME67361.1 WYL domain-containing protein [Flammeovirga aprica JL-4]